MQINKKTQQQKSPIYWGILAACGLGLLLTACGGSGNQSGQQSGDWGEPDSLALVEEDRYQRGLITTIKEVSPDSFKIVKEEMAPRVEDSRVIVQYLDGRTETLTVAQATQARNNPGYHGVSTILMGGMFGYLMGRSFNSYPVGSAYISPQAYNQVNRTTRDSFRRSRTVVRYNRRVYSQRALQNRSNATNTTTRPRGGSSGFGGSRSSRSFGG